LNRDERLITRVLVTLAVMLKEINFCCDFLRCAVSRAHEVRV
jgi:hypothetical protein